MTTANRPTARTRTRRKVIPDLSYLKANPSYKENLDYILAALELGGLVTCSQCKRVVGVGSSPASAVADGLRVGSAVKVDDEIRCLDHARV